MDKYEFSIKTDKIKKLVERKDYETAVKIADTIDWDRVRNIKMLSTVSLAYEKVSRYEEAKDLLLMAYECAPVGRRFLYKLTELATKQGQFDEAEQYLKEFAATSPQDPSRLVLRYEISQAKGEPTERLITILEAYQKREFEERWSYELANLYYRVGKNEECVKLCDEIVLWFGVGTYVDKAMELKQRIAPLTPDQIEKRENKEKYLRRLEAVQREFEEKYQVIQEPTAKAVEEVIQATQEPEVTSKVQQMEAAVEDALSQVVTEVLGEDVQVSSIEESVSEEEMISEEIPAEETAQEPTSAVEESVEEESIPEETVEAEISEPVVTIDLEQEAQRLQEEMEASLAREIEAATLTAALNEAMLRETAASMESMEPVENDHSQEHESTKIAMVRVPMDEKTREFVREAKAIRVVLEEVQGRQVTVEEVEARIEEPAVEEMPAAAEDSIAEEEPVQDEKPQEETSVEEPAAEEAPAEAEESIAQEELVEEMPAAVEEYVAEEEPVQDEKPQEETSVEEPAAEEVPAEAEESIAQEEPVEEMSARVEEPIVEDAPVQEEVPSVYDHYVLVACVNEDEGVKEGVSHIRARRQVLGYPVTQVAKITGEKLATKNMPQTLRKLQGRDLVVTGIFQLPDEMLMQTVEVMAQDGVESFIALVGSAEEVVALQSRQDFFRDCHVIACGVELPAVSSYYIEETVTALQEEVVETSLEEEQSLLAKMVEEALRATDFDGKQEPEAVVLEEEKAEHQEEVPSVAEPKMMESQAQVNRGGKMTPNDFYECAVQYAHMMDAKVDDMGGLAIYAVAEEYQQDRQPLTEELAQELIENAIAKAERRTIKSLFSNRYDKEGFLILKEQHFKD